MMCAAAPFLHASCRFDVLEVQMSRLGGGSGAVRCGARLGQGAAGISSFRLASSLIEGRSIHGYVVMRGGGAVELVCQA